jgi:hypothetical protein
LIPVAVVLVVRPEAVLAEIVTTLDRVAARHFAPAISRLLRSSSAMRAA